MQVAAIEPVAKSPVPSRPIRVVHLLHTVAHGGVETALLNWIRSMDPDRVKMDLVCFANPDHSEDAFLQSATAAGLKVRLIPWARSKPLLRSATALRRIFAELDTDIVHCHNTYANIVGLLAACRTRVRTVTTFYVWGDFGRTRNALQWIDKQLMPVFDEVSAHCEKCFDDTVARGYPRDKLKLFICGYPDTRVLMAPDERSKGRIQLGVSPEDTVLVYLARFWPEKAHDNLLAAFKLMLARNPRMRLWLPGTGPTLDAGKELAAQMGLNERVQFLGFRDDFHQLLAMSDIQVHPSDNEGVPLAVLAGMAEERPLIVSNFGELPEILKDGESALFVPPRKPDVLADTVLRLAAAPDRAAQLGRAARQFLETHYSLKVATARLERSYRELVPA
jgi:glycosyltransferase involved in cell wall biosynthesis